MSIVINADDPRSIRAIEIAAGSGQWLRVRTIEGELAFGIPSHCSPGRYWLTSASECDCPDFKRNGLTRGRIGTIGLHGPCKHVLAVQLHAELARAQQIRPRPQPALPTNVVALASRYSEIFGDES